MVPVEESVNPRFENAQWLWDYWSQLMCDKNRLDFWAEKTISVIANDNVDIELMAKRFAKIVLLLNLPSQFESSFNQLYLAESFQTITERRAVIVNKVELVKSLPKILLQMLRSKHKYVVAVFEQIANNRNASSGMTQAPIERRDKNSFANNVVQCVKLLKQVELQMYEEAVRRLGATCILCSKYFLL